MKSKIRKISLLLVLLLVCIFAFVGCNFTSCGIIKDGTPDELHIFGSDKSRSLSDYHIDYLKFNYYSTNLATIYDYDDMAVLFDLANELVLTKSQEDEHNNHYPEDFDLLCSVGFVREGTDGRPDVAYWFYVATTGEICYRRDRFAATAVFYTAESTEILNEVNRLIELYN